MIADSSAAAYEAVAERAANNEAAERPTHSLNFADTARVLGIALVVYSHMAALGLGSIHGFNVGRASAYIGIIGNSMLFILSGYLLGRPFLNALLDGTRLPSTLTFYYKRFLRIYPLYICTVLGVTAWETARGVAPKPLVASVVAHAALVHNLSTVTAGKIETPLWSMALMTQFYLVLPLVALALQPLTQRLSTSGRRNFIWSVLATIAVFSVLLRLAVMMVHPDSAATFVDQIVFLKQLPEMAFAFALGVGIVLFERSGVQVRNRGALLALGIAVAIVHAATRATANDSTGHSFGYAFGFAVYDALAAVAAGLIFLGLPRKASATPAMSVAADTSYGVYLFHYPILTYVVDTFNLGAKLLFVELLVVFIVVVLPIAWLTHRFIERPFFKIRADVSLRAKLKLKREVAAPVATGA